MTTAHILRATTAALAAFSLGLSVPAAAAPREAGVANASAASTATASTTASAAASRQSSAAAASPEQRICVRTSINSRILQTFCRTAQQWENQGGLIAD